jgi:NAD(P)-dependent dehydrogenase (short-subunit alcohol dehydrogenase family)
MVTFTVMPTTVILNADSGAGPAIAERFRADGHSVTTVRQADNARASLSQILRTAAPNGVDVLVNNAPILPTSPVSESSVDEFAASIDIGVNAVFSACREAAVLALETGTPLSVVNIVSVLGESALAGTASAACVSSAVIAVTKAFAIEWGTHGFKVSAVMVGPSGSSGGAEAPLPTFPGYRPLADPIEPNEVAAAVAYLAGPESPSVSGQALVVDSGWLAYGWHRGGP